MFRLESLRILFALAAIYGMTAHLIDASNAFVGSTLDKPNYLELFDGVEDYEPEARNGAVVLELLKSLYGLRQSANLWHSNIKDHIIKIGFEQSNADPSIFLNKRGMMIALMLTTS